MESPRINQDSNHEILNVRNASDSFGKMEGATVHVILEPPPAISLPFLCHFFAISLPFLLQLFNIRSTLRLQPIWIKVRSSANTPLTGRPWFHFFSSSFFSFY